MSLIHGGSHSQGIVPYKGYFDLEKAKEEENKLIEKGLDTRLRITAGYSTLGWFSDPVLSPQLRMTEDELVSLVIHELTHATVYFPGDSNFNESYASFVEEIGTEKFYRAFNTDKAEEVLLKEKNKITIRFYYFSSQTYCKQIKGII